MKEYGLYATFDTVAGVFGSVTVDISDGTAKRNFLFAVSQSAQLQYMAKDMELRRIGTIDLETGMIVPSALHEVICRGSEVVNDA